MDYPWIVKANKIFIGVLSGQFLLTLIVAFFTNTWFEGILIGLLILSLPLFLINTAPQSRITHHIVGIASQLFAALHIQQTMGLTELHFEIFAMLAILSCYRDWQVILSSVVFVAVHHILFYILQLNAMPLYIFEEGHLYFYILTIHALFALAEGGILMYVAKNTHKEAIAAFTLSSSIEGILRQQGQFDLKNYQQSSINELEDFNRLISSFSSFILKTNQVSESINASSKEMAILTDNVDVATNENASQINLIATATEEMTVANANVAEQAKSANINATAAFEQTENTKQIISNSANDIQGLKSDLSATSDTISELAAKCKQIEDVMNAIKSISDQTNLLALNAAIESARAGEHGRGFAVVADEVRQLAMKTRQNAEQISDITASLTNEASLSVEQMEKCLVQAESTVVQATEASHLMQDVVQNIESMASNMSSVASAADEQVLVSENISKSTEQLSDNSANLQQSAKQAGLEFERMKNNIDILNKELNRFEI